MLNRLFKLPKITQRVKKKDVTAFPFP